MTLNPDQRQAALERYGMGSYEPSVSAFFPAMRRGHGTQRRFGRCLAQGCRGDCRYQQTANIDEWLDQVGARIPSFDEVYGFVS